jgi:uncharacterized YccA/Bax inhibitor family protein
VIFDEAHLLDNAQLEAIRMLTLCRGDGYAEPAVAIGLLVSLVWLYLEILRLLAKLRSR